VSKRETMNSESMFSTSDTKFLRPEDVIAIEEALQRIGPFGELHLVVENGCLRYLRTVRSEPLNSVEHSIVSWKKET